MDGLCHPCGGLDPLCVNCDFDVSGVPQTCLAFAYNKVSNDDNCFEPKWRIETLASGDIVAVAWCDICESGFGESKLFFENKLSLSVTSLPTLITQIENTIAGNCLPCAEGCE